MRKRFIDKTLDAVERIGNALPNPATLFFLLAVATLVLSVWYVLGLPLGPGAPINYPGM